MCRDEPGQSIKSPSRRRSWRVGLCLASLLLFLLTACFIATSLWSKPAEQLLVEAREALERGNFEAAEKLASRCVSKNPQITGAYLVAGDAAERRGRLKQALDYYDGVKSDGSPDALESLFRSGKVSVQLGFASDGERRFRRVLEQNPQHVEAQKYLAFLLRLEGRNWELASSLVDLLRLTLPRNPQRQTESMTSLIYLLRPAGNPEWVWLEDHERKMIQQFRQTVPADMLPLLGEARVAAAENHEQRAKTIYRRILNAYPRQTEAAAQLGLILANSGSRDELLQWHNDLPAIADSHPGVWVARGIAARRFEQSTAAIRCYLEAVNLHPSHLLANLQLAQLLAQHGRIDEAERFAERARQLSRLENYIKQAGSEPQSIRGLATLLEELGRLWEAAAWYQVGIELLPEARWAVEGRRRVFSQLTNRTPLQLEEFNPARQINRQNYPLPGWDNMAGGPRDKLPATARSPVSFSDTAAAAGLRFLFENGNDPSDDRANMYEFSGGGVAVLDFDGDAWPDIYLTQGGAWNASKAADHPSNRLFRNLHNGQFEDVSESSAVTDAGYGQGVTAGDFNNDGFADLYVANIGGNRFYENNGDGTFTDITDSTQTAGNVWTISCAIADFNGDSLPDLYVVNYLGGPDVFTRVCRRNGQPVQCDPPMFPAEQDQLYLNLGDGRFQNITEEAGVVAADGKGMGLIVGDFRHSGKLDLFVANDTAPNFFFVNQTVNRGDRPTFSEEGLLRGVAFDENGQSQSSMGIAAGDADGDGLIDLFSTNLSNEANNLYSHQPDHMFRDSARPAGLYDSGFPLVGWGTQFVDGELDGRLDLVVANGDLETLPGREAAALMPLLYYANRGDTRFELAPASELGPYFERKRLGRAVATLDWNRDGLDDFCVTNVGTPAGLLENTTQDHGQYLVLRLRGVQSSRDAIGTIARVTTGERTLVRQLTAGDGFCACNERRLVFGLGASQLIDRMTIVWPSGLEQTFGDIAANQDVIAIEGRPQLLP